MDGQQIGGSASRIGEVRESKRLSLVLLTVSHGTVDFYNALLQAVAPGLALYLGLPIGTVVALVGICQLITNAIQPIAGLVMEKKNLAWILWFALFLSVCPAFMGFATGYWSLFLIVAVGSAATGLFHPEAVLSAHDTAGEKAYLGIPMFMAGGFCFSSLAAPVGIMFSERFGFPSLAFLAIPGLFVALLMLTRQRERKRHHESIFLRPRSKRITRKIVGSVSFFPLFASATCFGIATGLFTAVFSSHYELTFGADARMWSGWVLLVMGLGGSVSAFGWSALSRRFGFYRIVLATQLVAMPLYYYLGRVPSPQTGFFVALVLCVVAPGAMYNMSVGLAKDASGLTQTLRTGLMTGGTWGVAAIVTLIAATLLKRGVPSSTIMIIPACACLAAILIASWQLIRRET